MSEVTKLPQGEQCQAEFDGALCGEGRFALVHNRSANECSECSIGDRCRKLYCHKFYGTQPLRDDGPTFDEVMRQIAEEKVPAKEIDGMYDALAFLGGDLDLRRSDVERIVNVFVAQGWQRGHDAPKTGRLHRSETEQSEGNNTQETFDAFLWRDQKLSPGQVLVACKAWWALTSHQREEFRKQFGWPKDGLSVYPPKSSVQAQPQDDRRVIEAEDCLSCHGSGEIPNGLRMGACSICHGRGITFSDVNSELASKLIAIANTGFGYDLTMRDKFAIIKAAAAIHPESTRAVQCMHADHEVMLGDIARHNRIVHAEITL